MMPGFKKIYVSTSKNVTIFLEPGTDVTISFHRHIDFLGSAWNNQKFQNLPGPGFWVPGFFNSGFESQGRSSPIQT